MINAKLKGDYIKQDETIIDFVQCPNTAYM